MTGSSGHGPTIGSGASLPASARCDAGGRPPDGWPDAEAVRRFHDRTRRLFRAVVRRRTYRQPEIDPDDVLQEAYIALIARLASDGGADSEESLRKLATIIVSRRAADAVRRHRRHAEFASDAIDSIACPASGSGDRRVIRFEDRDLVLGLLAALPEEQRAAIHLVYVRGLTYADAARHLEVKMNTLKTRIYRGLDALRALAVERGLASPHRDPEVDR